MLGDVDNEPHDPTDAWLHWLDAEDGGYDWGPDGPPDAIDALDRHRWVDL